MMETAPPPGEGTPLDRGLRALCGIAAYYRIGAERTQSLVFPVVLKPDAETIAVDG
jgi:hypothetical protein